MEFRINNPFISDFEFEGILLPVDFVETTNVVNGVTCDVYKFTGDDSKDLGIIRIDPGHKTPLQKVLGGVKTIEGYVSGSGKLTITKSNGRVETHTVTDKPDEYLSVPVEIGDTMQWEASPNSRLVAYEVCIPPYQDGRYQNL